jgi:hypothetical protein
MAFLDVPQIGDVLIRRGHGPDAKPLMVLSSVPGPDQLAYATRVEAERVACAYAEHAGVNVWLAEFNSEFTLLFRCRESSPVHRSATAARRRSSTQFKREAIVAVS